MRAFNFFILFFLSACSNFNEVKKISTYYNIDSLLSSQIIILPNSNNLKFERFLLILKAIASNPENNSVCLKTDKSLLKGLSMFMQIFRN